MTRQKGNKDHKRPKHGQGEELHDWVIQAKTSKVPLPVARLEESSSTECILEVVPYNKKITTEQPISPKSASTFRFLSLPAELRIIVYRYSLRCYRPIVPGGTKVQSIRLQIDKRDKVAINLLRTCKQIHIEGSAIFYGENAFELLHDYAQPSIVALMSPANIDWLKELNIEIPFIYSYLYVDQSALRFISSVPPHKRVVGTGVCRTDFLLNYLMQLNLDAICNAANLRKLVMVIEPRWHLYCSPRIDRRQLEPDLTGQIRAYLNIPDVLEDLGTLMKHKPHLEITVVRLYPAGKPTEPDRYHKKVLKMMERHLGIWDVREAPVFVNEKKKRRHWAMPPVDSSKDPSDVLLSIRAIFDVAAW